MANNIAVAGTPINFPEAELFSWLMSDPFATESEITPASHVLPKVEDERALFVDNDTSTFLTFFALLRQD